MHATKDQKMNSIANLTPSERAEIYRWLRECDRQGINPIMAPGMQPLPRDVRLEERTEARTFPQQHTNPHGD